MKNEDLKKLVAQFITAVANSDKDSAKDPVYINYRQAKEIFGFSRWKFYRLIRQGKITATKAGESQKSRVRILLSSVLDYFAAREIKPQEIEKGVEK